MVVILIPDGNIKSFKAEINGLAKCRGKFTRFWNSEARFVVVGAIKFSLSQHTDIFDYSSKFRMCNYIIVSQENYAKDKEYNRQTKFNDIDTGMKLEVYTWFPYRNSDCCTVLNVITLLDSWVISAQGHFTKDTDLFPVKINNSLNGCPMKAVVRECHWGFTTEHVHQRNSNSNVGRYINPWSM